MRQIEGVLFDFDHTLADFGDHVAWEDARDEVAAVYAAHGVPQDAIGRGSVTLYGRMASSGLLDAVSLEQAQREAAAVLDRYERTAVEATRILPCVARGLDTLARLRIPVAVVSSNSAAVVRSILERANLAMRLAAIVGREHVRLPKPAPEGLLVACAELAVEPRAALYAGDHVADVKAALAAGIVPCGVRGGISSAEALVASGAVVVVDDVAELVAKLVAGSLPALRLRGAS